MVSLSSPADVGPTEEVVLALLDYLVDPMLPLKSNVGGPPSIDQQKSVAAQMHAAVILYNYYHRTWNPDLEFLDFASFCKLGIILKPSLMAHMKFVHQSDHSDVDKLEDHLSLTERAIMDACAISRTLLHVSHDVPSSVKEWPIGKVAVLLIDAKKENCLLLFSSITNGVWSVIEKDVHSKDTPGGSKRKRSNITKPCLLGKQDSDDEAGFQQIAFSAIMEETGIASDDLKVLEGHKVYSLSREKTATRFYIVQCTRSIKEDLQVVIEDVINSLQGPVVKKSSRSWIVNPVVEYFHVLPYAGILVDWFSREVLSNGLKDGMQDGNIAKDICQSSENSFENEMHESQTFVPNASENILTVRLEREHDNGSRIEQCCDDKVVENCDMSDKRIALESIGEAADGLIISEVIKHPCGTEVIEATNGCVGEASIVGSKILKQIENPAPSRLGLLNPSNGPKVMDINESHLACSNNENESKLTHMILEVSQHADNKTNPTNCDNFKAGISVVKKMKIMSESKNGKFDAERKSRIVSSQTDRMLTGDSALIPSEHNSALIPSEHNGNYLEKLGSTTATKGSKWSHTAFRVLIQKREKLSKQLRQLEDELAVCDRNIMAVLNAAENDLDLEMKATIDCSSDVCLLKDLHAKDRETQHVGQGLPRYSEVEGLSKGDFTMQNPCQVDLCNAMVKGCDSSVVRPLQSSPTA